MLKLGLTKKRAVADYKSLNESGLRNLPATALYNSTFRKPLEVPPQLKNLYILRSIKSDPSKALLNEQGSEKTYNLEFKLPYMSKLLSLLIEACDKEDVLITLTMRPKASCSKVSSPASRP